MFVFYCDEPTVNTTINNINSNSNKKNHPVQNSLNIINDEPIKNSNNNTQKNKSDTNQGVYNTQNNSSHYHTHHNVQENNVTKTNSLNVKKINNSNNTNKSTLKQKGGNIIMNNDVSNVLNVSNTFNANALNASNKNDVDLRLLKGILILYENFLSTLERKTLMRNFRHILHYNYTSYDNKINSQKDTRRSFAKKRERQNYINSLLCGDILLTRDQYLEIFKDTPFETNECNKVQSFNEKYIIEKGHNVDTLATLKGKNPIFAGFCSLQKHVIVDLKTIAKVDSIKLMQMYNSMKIEYKRDIEKVHSILKEFVVLNVKKQIYTLKQISPMELKDIEIKIKQIVIQFYFQTLINYQNLLDFALSLAQ
jgi:hypothetical protein